MSNIVNSKMTASLFEKASQSFFGGGGQRLGDSFGKWSDRQSRRYVRKVRTFAAIGGLKLFQFKRLLNGKENECSVFFCTNFVYTEQN